MFYLSPENYAFAFNLVLETLVIVYSIYIFSFEDTEAQQSKRLRLFYSLFLAISIAFFLGRRPFTKEMGDTSYYVYSFIHYDGYASIDFKTEWLWHNLNVFCRDVLHQTPSSFMTLIAIVYVGGLFLFCFVHIRNRIWVALLFCFTSFSFYAYGVNGIRNGMACSILLISMLFFLSENKWKYLIGFVILLMAFGIHRSALLPCISIIVSTFLIKQPSTAIKFWLASIVISLIAGNIIGDYLASTELFEEKMGYFNDAELSANAEQFSSTGFRFDFLLYSAMPVLMTWYVTMKRDFQDRTFNIIACTYILANAFWVMVIRAEYSNRFAYLSWFLYPIVIAYPLLRMNLWENQNRKTALILLAYAGFTFVMFLIGK